MKRGLFCLLLLAVAAIARPGALQAQGNTTWDKDYEQGLKAASSENWSDVVRLMTSAIAKKPKEDPRARPYGNVFLAYHPYYYRGNAYYELGQWQAAIDDLERTTGVGRVTLKSADTLIDRAKAKLITGTPTPVVPPPSPSLPPPSQTPSLPTTPSVDPAVEQNRQRATEAIRTADRAALASEKQGAQTLAANTYLAAAELLTDAKTRMATPPRTAAEFLSIANVAERATQTYAAAGQQAQLVQTKNQTSPTRAADAALADTRTRIVLALEDYYRGNYQRAARELKKITDGEGRSNAMLWAFLGAAQYSSYYMDGERTPTVLREAQTSFRRARQLKKTLKELPRDFFSPRIRRAYRETQ